MKTRLILGDCLKIMPTLGAEKIACIITDPPYGIALRNGDVAVRPASLA